MSRNKMTEDKEMKTTQTKFDKRLSFIFDSEDPEDMKRVEALQAMGRSKTDFLRYITDMYIQQYGHLEPKSSEMGIIFRMIRSRGLAPDQNYKEEDVWRRK